MGALNQIILEKYGFNSKAEAIFSQIQDFVNLLNFSDQQALIVHGKPGLSKTDTVKKALKAMGVKHKIAKASFSTVGDFYKVLYNNNDCILVLDESEELLKRNSIFRKLMLTILEPGKGNRTPHYFKSTDKDLITKSNPNQGTIPQKFVFTGKLIMISNKNIDTLDDAIRSRSLDVHIDLSKTEVLEEIKNNLHNYNQDIDYGLKLKVYEYLKSIKARLKRIDFRTYRKLLDMANILGDKYRLYALNIVG